jgi:hypothetical protein
MLPVDLTQDYQYTDATEAATFSAQRSSGQFTVPLSFAKRLDLDRALGRSLGIVSIEQDAIAWYVSGNELAANNSGLSDCQEGDTITDAAGIVWSVFSSQYTAETNMWLLATRVQLQSQGS